MKPRNKPRVCVDFDNVIAHHSIDMGPYYFGPVIEGAREFLKRLSKIAYVVIYSARVNVDVTLAEDIRDYMISNNLYFDEIYTGIGKSEAVAYIDDRAIECNPSVNKEDYNYALQKTIDNIRCYFDGNKKWSRP